jgi:hypothetical protein
LLELVGNGRQLLAELEAVEEQLRKTAEQLMVGKTSAADSMKDTDKTWATIFKFCKRAAKSDERSLCC